MSPSSSFAVALRVALVLITLWAPNAAAQETINSATVGGRITDAQGGAVPGATVTARQTETGVSADRTTDNAGRFRFPYLRVGPYNLLVSAPGFDPWRQTLVLNAGAAFEIPVELSVAGLAESVAVQAEAPLVESARSQLAVTVSQERGQQPAAERPQLPGHRAAGALGGASQFNSTQLFPETSAVPGIGLSVGSQRNLSNNFIVDGLSSNDDAAGLSGMPYGVDAVEQFQVVTSGGQAELGRALGGYVNVVTRSGTNQLHGTATGIFATTHSMPPTR